MANNRMYLVHRPTGKGVFLGKRFGYDQWYRPVAGHLEAKLEELFRVAHEDGVTGGADFVLVMEDASESPGALGDNALPFQEA